MQNLVSRETLADVWRRHLADSLQVLKLLVGPARVRRAPPSLGKVCPPADLTQFDGIVTVARVDGCLTTARAAFEAYVLKAVAAETP